MFGVLVVEDKEGKLGYLSAFSGKLAGSNHHQGFVPPVFDMLTEQGFFLKEIKNISAINLQIKEIESGAEYNSLQQDIEQLRVTATSEITELKERINSNKITRKQQREQQQKLLSEDDYEYFEAAMIKQSLYDKHLLHELLNKWELALAGKKTELERHEAELETLITERKERSAALQKQLFEHYEFLNKNGDRKSLLAIFRDTVLGKPPSAAGECATPKLLQYAFLNGYKPLAMAEFWWGAAPGSEIRKHKQFYPACTEKCNPILKHMLEGIALEKDPRINS
ncbi:MAG: hypothetical protein JWQ38_2640 [Flavipsychrobacter sp.]|nr:hypothetical protein [Flavipsychrobacter sp.]